MSGRGSVRKRGRSWQIVYDLGLDPVSGKRRQKTEGGFGTERAAKRELTKRLRALDDGSYVEPTGETLAQFAKEWLAAITPTIRPSTHHSYERNLRLHVLSGLGEVPMVKVDGAMLNALYGELLAHGRADGQGLSGRSVRYIHSIVHRMFRDAMRWGRLVRNPTDAADPPRAAAARRRQIHTWPAETVAEFLDRSSSTGDRYFPLWVVLASTGARRGEVLGLRWRDVDLEGGRAQIHQTVIAVHHEVHFGEPKTAKGRRSLSLDPGTVRVLRAWRAKQGEEKMLLGPGYDDHDLVFAKVTGQPLHPERVSREFDRRVERWDLERITLHGLRHSWATTALAAGIHPRIVQERLGHATVAITLDLYSHTTATLHDQAADLVGSLIFREQTVSESPSRRQR
jgi:integrase